MKYLPGTVLLVCFILIYPATGCRSSGSGSNSLQGVTDPAYYVDTKLGSDNNAGDINHPLRTLPGLNERLKAKPASVYLAAGQVYDGKLILSGYEGTVNNPLLITSYGSGRAVINGGDDEAVHIENCSRVVIKNLDFKGSGRKEGNVTNGLSLSGSRNCIVSAISATGFQISGVDLHNCKDMKVLNVAAFNNGFSGINVMGSDRASSGNIEIRNCTAENNPGDPAILDNHSGNGILVGVSDSVLIDHCTATNNGWDMPRKGNGPVGIWTWESNRVCIQYCISYRNKTSEGAMDGGGFDLDGGVTNSLIRYCLSYENQGAGYGLFQYAGASAWSGNVIEYCISINDAVSTKGAGSVFIWNGSADTAMLADCMVSNNVFYNDASPVVSFEQSSAHRNFRFCNNIFMGNGSVLSGNPKGSLFLGNDWWNAGESINFMGYSSLEEWAHATGQEMLDGRMTGMQADPGFKGPLITELTDPWKLNDLKGFILNDNSPLRGKGIDIKGLFGTNVADHDFYGNSIPAGKAVEPGIYRMN